jgi:hypothetical protein
VDSIYEFNISAETSKGQNRHARSLAACLTLCVEFLIQQAVFSYLSSYLCEMALLNIHCDQTVRLVLPLL